MFCFFSHHRLGVVSCDLPPPSNPGIVSLFETQAPTHLGFNVGVRCYRCRLGVQIWMVKMGKKVDPKKPPITVPLDVLK